MRTFAKLFGQSPFVPLQSHMEKVAACVSMVPELFSLASKGDYEGVAKLADEVSKLEHEADQVKHDIQTHLPRSLFLPIDRERLLEILSIQDNIADKAENIGVLLTLKDVSIAPFLTEGFQALLDKNIEAFDAVHRIIGEVDELLETGFGGDEAERVLAMVDDVAFKEHEADVLQRSLLKTLFAHEGDLSVGDFFLWTQLFRQVSDLSNLSERLAHRVRRTLELK